MERDIKSYFGGTGASKRAHEPDTQTYKSKKGPAPVTATVKTVERWRQQLNIDLGYESKDGTVFSMWCRVCREHPGSRDKSSPFIAGSPNIKKESVVSHIKSEAHVAAHQAKVAAKKISEKQPTPIDISLQKLEEKDMQKMIWLFNTAYYIASEERPFTDFDNLIKLQKMNSLDLGETYSNAHSCKTFVSEIASYYFEMLKTKLENADFFSVFSDGTTDRTESEKEVIMIKFLDNFYPVTHYLKLKEPENTKAEGILKCVDDAFEEFGLHEYHKKLVGYCSDGASVMMGNKKGVIKLLKDRKDAPWVLAVWCLAHKLELAVKDCFKNTYMEKVIEVLKLIYDFYKGSSKRNKEAEEIAKIVEEEFLKPEKVNGTRWIDHKLRATAKLLRNYTVILTHMENYAGDNSNRDFDRAKARGIIDKLLEYKLVWFLSFSKDLLNELATVSLTFQRDDISTSSAVTKLQSVDITLRNMYDNQGPCLTEMNQAMQEQDGRYVYKGHTLRHFVENDVLERQKKQIVQSMQDCLSARFQNLFEEQIFLVCHAFDHKNWPEDDAGLVQYGTDEVRAVYRHFQPLLENANCDLNAALREFTELKLHVTRNSYIYRNVHPLAVFQRISQEDEDKADFSNILKIIHLTNVYPVSNACCERSFSTLKRVKSDWRCRLNTETIDQLLRIVLTGPAFHDFDARPVVQRWWVGGQRMRRPHVLPLGPRH